MEFEKINFGYDPISVTRLLIQIYIEKFIEGKTFKEITLTFYKFVDTMTDEECEDIIRVYALKKGIDEITYSEFEEDFKSITSIIEARNKT